MGARLFRTGVRFFILGWSIDICWKFLPVKEKSNLLPYENNCDKVVFTKPPCYSEAFSSARSKILSKDQLIAIRSIYWIPWVKLMHIGLKHEESLMDKVCLETEFGFLFPCFTLFSLQHFSRVIKKWLYKLVNFFCRHHIPWEQRNKYIDSKIAENQACCFR